MKRENSRLRAKVRWFRALVGLGGKRMRSRALQALIGAAVVLGLFAVPGAMRGAEVQASAGTTPYLYFSNENSANVQMKDLTTGDVTTLVTQGTSGFRYPTTIDIDQDGGFLYYADRDFNVHKVDLASRSIVQSYNSEKFVQYVDFDRTNRKLYFSDSLVRDVTIESRLRVMHEDGNVETLFEDPGVYASMFGIAADPTGSYVYFFRLKGINPQEAVIYRMSMATKEITTYKSDFGGYTTDLEVDEANRKMYYTVGNQVGVIDLNTGNASILYNSPNGNELIKHIDYDSVSGKVYFSVSSEFYDDRVTIYRMNADGSNLYEVHSGDKIKGFAVNEVPSFTMQPVADITLNELDAGYASGSQEEREVRLTRTGVGVLQNVTVTLGNPDQFALSQPPGLTVLDDNYSETAIKLKAKDGLAPGIYTTIVTVKADQMADVTFNVTQVVHAYSIAPLADVTLDELTAGYASGSSRTVTVTRTGSGALDNLSVSLSGAGAGAFELAGPSAVRLDDATPSATFEVRSRDGLAPGTYKATVTVAADRMTAVTFEVTQVVGHTYSIAPLTDVTLDELTAGYASGSSRTVTVTRTGTGVLDNLSVSLSGADAGAFELAGPSAVRLDDATPSATFEVRSRDGLAKGNYTAAVTVRADRMADRTFAVGLTVHPSQDATLRALSVSAGTLSPSFAADVTDYDVNVPHEIDAITVTAVANDANASFTYYADGASATDTITLKVGVTRIEVRVIADDNAASRTYTIDVTRAPSGNAAIGSLSLDGVTLNETVHADTLSYTAAVPNDTALTRVHAVPADANAVVSAVLANQTPAAPGEDIELSVGTNVIEVEVTAQDNVTKRSYTITVERAASDNARLGSLTLSQGALNPAFDPNTRSYTVDVSHETESISVTASTAHDRASMTVNGRTVASGTSADAALSVGSNEITIVVTAENGVATETYTITVNRAASLNADLSGLALSEGTLSPDFAADVADYRATVPYRVTQLTVIADAAHDGATLTINGIAAASGAESLPIELKTGENRISVIVTAQDGLTTRTYEVVVVRQSPPPPPVIVQPDDQEEEADSLSVYVNGTRLDGLAASEVEERDGRTIVEVSFDEQALIALLKEGKDRPEIIVPVENEADQVSVLLSGNLVQTLAAKQGMIIVRTPNGSFRLPAAELSAERLGGAIGVDLAGRADKRTGGGWPGELTVRLSIAAGDPSMAETLVRLGTEQGFAVAAPPAEFTVAAEYNGKSVQISGFTKYVQYEVPLPDSRNRGTVTAVAVNEDGTIRHLPTLLAERDGVVHAVASSMISGAVALIGQSVSFEDTGSHWGRAAIEDLASRTVLNGAAPGMFQPDAAITRAEFAAIVVRALGLTGDGGGKLPADVQAGDWHAPAVAAAQLHGIVGGYEDGTFRPSAAITREEAMVMIARAMKTAGMESGAGNADDVLAGFADAERISGWAKDAAAAVVSQGLASGSNGQLRPGDAISRAETAVIVHRLLQEAGLIGG